MHSDKSFKESKNNNGPTMDPCGVPEVTVDHSEHIPLTTTRCLRPIREFLSQFSKQPSTPRGFSISKAGDHEGQ